VKHILGVLKHNRKRDLFVFFLSVGAKQSKVTCHTEAYSLPYVKRITWSRSFWCDL